MPIIRSNYPPAWDELCVELKRAADWKCEECEAQHGTMIYRERGTDRWTESLEIARATFWRGYYRSETQLQVAHLGIPKPDGTTGDKSDTMDCRPENLRVLCRRCHLAFDLPENIPQRRRTRLRRRRETAIEHGQIMFWEELR